MSAPGMTSVGGTRSIQNPNLGKAPNSDATLINQYLKANYPKSPLVGHGQDFVDAVNTYAPGLGLPTLLAAIAIQESGAGTVGLGATGNNPFNLGPGLKYPSIRAGIFAAAATIARRSPTGWDPVVIGSWYAPQAAGNDTATWIRNVELITTQIQKSVPPSGPQGGKSTAPFSGTGPGGTDAGTAINTGVFGLGVGPNILTNNPLDAIAAFFSWLTDPSKWLRIGEMILGVGGLALGVFAFIKGRTVFALLLAMAGYLFLFSGIKNISPIREIQDAFKGK